MANEYYSTLYSIDFRLNANGETIKISPGDVVSLADNAFEFNRKNNRLAQAIGVYGGVFICAVLF